MVIQPGSLKGLLFGMGPAMIVDILIQITFNESTANPGRVSALLVNEMVYLRWKQLTQPGV
jgi:hypothetical protein